MPLPSGIDGRRHNPPSSVLTFLQVLSLPPGIGLTVIVHAHNLFALPGQTFSRLADTVGRADGDGRFVDRYVFAQLRLYCERSGRRQQYGATDAVDISDRAGRRPDVLRSDQ